MSIAHLGNVAQAGDGPRLYAVGMGEERSQILCSILGPLLGAMQHAKDLYGLGPHAVGEDVRRSRDDKLTGIGHTTCSTGRGIVT